MSKYNALKPLHKPIRVAMIGGGVNSAVGRVHEIAMKMDNEFDLVAGCFSRNPEFNAESGRQYNVPANKLYPSAEALIDAVAHEVDAVVIATPIKSHAQYIHLALDHNLRVISDKPLLANVQECKELLARIHPDNTQVFSIFNYTGYPAVREMKRRVESGAIGSVFKVMVEMPQDSYMRLSNQNKTHAIQAWRLEDGDISCVSLDLFVHLHSLVNFVCGNTPVAVNAWQRAITNVSPGLIDEVDAVIQYSNNLMVNAWYGKASLQWHQESPEMIEAADEAGNRMLLDRISTGSEITAQPRYNRFKAGHPSGFIEAFANYYTDIAQAMRNEKLNAYTLSTGVAAEGLALSQAIAQASASGRTVQL